MNKSRWSREGNTFTLDTSDDPRYELPYVFDRDYDVKTKAELRRPLKDMERDLRELPGRINELKCLIAQYKICGILKS